MWALREREADCCGQKIAYFLEREYGVHLSVPKIYGILKEKYVIRSKWKKRVRRGPVPQAQGPREVLQLDTIDFGGLFAFTAIDIYTKEADILVAPALTARYPAGRTNSLSPPGRTASMGTCNSSRLMVAASLRRYSCSA